MPVPHVSIGAEIKAPTFGAEQAPKFPLVFRFSAPMSQNRSFAFPSHVIHTIHITQTIQIYGIKVFPTVKTGSIGLFSQPARA